MIRMLKPLAALAVILAQPAQAQDTSERDRAMVKMLEESYAAAPDPALKYLLAESYARLGQPAQSAKALKAVVDSGQPFLPPPDNAMWKYAADPEMKLLLDALKGRFPITSNGMVEYQVKGPPIITEGIAYDPMSKQVFLGDLLGRAILEVGPDGTSKPLVTGLELQPYGMAVDAARRHLWVAVSNFITGESTAKTALLRIHLDTKETKTFSHPEAKALNDLVVSQAGDVYTTDMGASMVWRVSAADGSWSQAVEPGSISFPNGLALDETGQRLFLSQGRRLMTKSLPDGKLEPIRKPDDFSTLGTDGLYYRDGSLYGIQNVTSPGRIVRMRLDADRTGIVGTDVLESANPLFDLPTTGAFMGDKLLVIANSQIYRIDRREPDPSELKPIVLLSYDTGSASRN